MKQRKREDTDTGAYHSESSLEFITSGCVLLDCVLGGGWPLGRIGNVVGDKSTGKTLIAIEAVANFHNKYPNGRIWYYEAEAAFDIPYAKALGIPTDAVQFMGVNNEVDATVEDLFNVITGIVNELEGSDEPGLFIVDSIDALTTEVELNRDIDKGTFGGEKPKLIGQLLRRLVRRIKSTRLAIIFISQERDKIGVSFGKKTTRSGGRALDFYASQVLWLHKAKTISRTVKGLQRPIGVNIIAKCEKNKIGMPFRACVFPIYFGYGIDDIKAHIDFLKSVKKLNTVKNMDASELERIARSPLDLDEDTYKKISVRLRNAVRRAWKEVEQGFAPPRRKY